MECVFLNNISQSSHLIPFIDGKVPAGFPSPAMDYMEERIDLVKILSPHPQSTFYVRSTGDSLLDAFIPPDSILIVDRSITPKSGDIVVVFINGGFTVKYIDFKGKDCWLIPANRAKGYMPLKVTEEMGMIVWGYVTAIVIETKNISHVRPC